MSRNIAYPFLRATERSVQLREWQITSGEKSIATGSTYAAGWDYQAPIRVQRDLEVDFQALAQELEISPEAFRASAVARIGTGAGPMPRRVVRIVRVPLEYSGGVARIDLTVPGSELSARLHLALDIVIDSLGGPVGRLSPRWAGSRVWGDVLRVDLEGSESRFPLEQLDFGRYFHGTPESSAPWLLHWSPGDLEREFNGAVRLFINDANKEFIKRLNEGDRLLQQAMMGDVKAQLIQGCLEQETDLRVYRAGEPGTLGAVVGEWIEMLWPGEGGDAVMQKIQNSPGRFRAAVLASVEMPEISK